ncbi:hypothetical protein GIB67_012969 [Kingdonia uniflora]|uniref:Uncharacterized protein n=1 Tax=Kingdonia uniflora TaxID=39325 RepID=A0A7J7NGG1_9MAGN|nr:hypothetical protein GIB67_012969 [Kingdonia uniflora]
MTNKIKWLTTLHSKITVMEDSTNMTIEFLRARLLSERSASRSARQRADELAKKVVELEEQLKIATLQRAKAEKETVEVLAILKKNGINDFSQILRNSNSDQETLPAESKARDISTSEEGCSEISVSRSNEADELSGEDSVISSRSLSWRNRSISPEKRCIDQARIQYWCTPVSSDDASKKSHMGKSCRQIKQRNPLVNELGDASTCYKNTPEISIENFKNEEETMFEEGIFLNTAADERIEANGGDASISGLVANMERALDNKAELVERYEAEENAQSQWEETFCESNNCIQDSCEHRNQSDITEERDEIDETREHSSTIFSSGESARSLHRACLDTESSPPQDQQLDDINNPVMETLTSFSEFSFSCQEYPEPTTKGTCVSFEHQFRVCNSVSSKGQNELQTATSDNFSSVLEALQQAKVSLKHHLDMLPSLKRARPSVRLTEEMPSGRAGLLKVPNDSQFQTTSQSNLYGTISLTKSPHLEINSTSSSNIYYDPSLLTGKSTFYSDLRLRKSSKDTTLLELFTRES